jgi:hypothetical protein
MPRYPKWYIPIKKFRTKLCADFWRVRKISKSNSWLNHVCPPVRLETLSFPSTGFREIWLSISRICVEKIQVLLKYDKNNVYFTWRHVIFMIILPQFFLEWEIFQTKLKRKSKHTFCFPQFYLNSSFLRDNVSKYDTAGTATDGYNMAHAFCLLDN